jgi:phage repressor protein C with HTH and peptisase S24 domain
MEPSYKEGDLVLGLCWFTPKPGQVVILKTDQRYLIKRIIRLEPGQVWVEGDNKAASTDSRTKGLYSTSEIEAKAVARL